MLRISAYPVLRRDHQPRFLGSGSDGGGVSAGPEVSAGAGLLSVLATTGSVPCSVLTVSSFGLRDRLRRLRLGAGVSSSACFGE